MDRDLGVNLVGFRINGVDKITKSSSGTSTELLAEFVDLLLNYKLKEIKTRAKKLKVFNLSDNLSKFLKVAKINQDMSIGDFYYYMNNCSELVCNLSLGYMHDGSHYLNQGDCNTMCILNLDKDVLESYKGFQSKKHNKGRYAKIKCKGIPVALVEEVKIDVIKKLYNYMEKGVNFNAKDFK